MNDSRRNIIPDEKGGAKQPEEYSRLPKSCQRMYAHILGMYGLYNRQGRRPKHCDVFISNKDFVKRLGIKRLTVIRGKKILKGAGLIDYEIHQGRGKATDFWILEKMPQVKKSTVPTQATKIPIDPEAVRRLARTMGKKWILNADNRMGCSKAEIEACLEQ